MIGGVPQILMCQIPQSMERNFPITLIFVQDTESECYRLISSVVPLGISLRPKSFRYNPDVPGANAGENPAANRNDEVGVV